VTIDRVRIMIGFIEHLHNVTKNNYSAIANSRTKSSQSAVSSSVVAWWQIPTMPSASVLASIPCLTPTYYNISVRILIRKHHSSVVCGPLPSNGLCLIVSRSLSSNGCTCHNTFHYCHLIILLLTIRNSEPG
jgi:hypothetical protein